MSVLENIFNTAAGWYGAAFGEWLYISFWIRTLILLLCVWAAIFIAAQLIRFVIGPLLILFFCHVIFRAWNFLFVETFQEWIYIHYYSKEKPFLSETYLKLCDKIKDNRLKLECTRYKGILLNGGTRKTAFRLMVIALIAGTLWVIAFGLYHEYAYVPNAGGSGLNAPSATADPAYNESLSGETPSGEQSIGETPPSLGLTTESPAPASAEPTEPPDIFWLESAYLYLNEYGYDGANVRDMPDSSDSTVVEVVWGKAEFENLGAYYEDASTPGMFWVKIRTAAGTEGYISSRLLQTEAS